MSQAKTLMADHGICAVVDDVIDAPAARRLFKYLMSDVGLRFSRVNNVGQSEFPSLCAILDSEHTHRCPELLLLMETAAAHSGVSKHSLRLHRVQVNVTCFGDIQYVHRDAQSDITAIYFANPEWDIDWLGELYFYDDSKAEVTQAVTPKPGRMAVFESNRWHRGGTPARAGVAPRVTLALKFSRVTE